MENKRYIHYGATKFDLSRMVEVLPTVIARSGSKPGHAGLWGSPVGVGGWKKWCAENDFRLDSFGESFTFSLKEGSRILTIDSVEDFLNHSVMVLVAGMFDDRILDFKEIVKAYDAIFLTKKGMWETRDPGGLAGMGTYGWDCESIVVFRPSSIVPEVA